MMMTEEMDMTGEEQQLKAELGRYFTAVVDEQYLRQYPDQIKSALGTPMFYDEYGELDVDYISEMTGMSPTGVRTSFDAWRAKGGVPPTEAPATPTSGASRSSTPLSRPRLGTIDIPKRPSSGNSFLSETKEAMSDVIELRQLERELEQTEPSYPLATQAPPSELTAVIAALAPLLKQDRPSIDPMTMSLMKQLNDRTNDGTAQMIALFNMNQQSNQQWMTLLMENMKQGGTRSTLEDRLLNHSLDKMLSGGDTPEESIWGELVRTGQLGEIVQGAAAGLSGLASRRPPMGENPYAETQQAVVEAPAPAELAPTFDAPEPSPVTMSFQEKCTHIMTEMVPTLPDEWTSDGDTMQMLLNATEISVKRGEDLYPTNLDMQLGQSAKEMLLVANLRTLGTSLSKIEKGEISIELASSMLTGHPLWPVFSGESVDSLLNTINSYAVADLEDSPSLLHDLEYLNRPTTRPIIESLLATAGGGVTE